MSKQFKDSKGLKGRPLRAPISETSLNTRPSSHSLQTLYPNPQTIQVTKRNNYYYFNFTQVIGDKARVKSSDAKRLAKWILDLDGDKNENKHKTK